MGLMHKSEQIQMDLVLSETLRSHEDLINKIRECHFLAQSLREAGELLYQAIERKNSILVVGNGGSAADAQHIACELAGRHRLNRPAIRAEFLMGNLGLLTAIANDFSYDTAVVRMLEARARPGDVLLAISTSGNSKNILNAISRARELDVQVIGMTGESGGEMARVCSTLLRVPSSDTPRIQEGHILMAHTLLEYLEKKMVQSDLENS